MLNAYEITPSQKQVAKMDLRQIPALSKQKMEHMDLPEKYKAAKAALLECWRVDEIKDISDKHTAIAVYAKQAKDKALLYYAERIKLRAYARIGELLNEIQDHKERGAHAKKNGIYAQNIKLSCEIANVPPKVRDKLIDATPPPNLTKLASYGNGYTPAPQTGFQREYLPRESQHIRTAKQCAEVFYNTMCDLEHELRSAQRNPAGDDHSFAQMAKAVPASKAHYYEEAVVDLMKILREFLDNLPGRS
jgi:hypothetical protein